MSLMAYIPSREQVTGTVRAAVTAGVAAVGGALGRGVAMAMGPQVVFRLALSSGLGYTAAYGAAGTATPLLLTAGTTAGAAAAPMAAALLTRVASVVADRIMGALREQPAIAAHVLVRALPLPLPGPERPLAQEIPLAEAELVQVPVAEGEPVEEGEQ